MIDYDIEEIKDPAENKLTFKTKSILFSRMVKSSKNDEFKSATIKLFEVNNPHKEQVFPTKIIKFSNTEKVRIMGLNVSYYLEGNDIVVNDLTEVTIEHEPNKLFITGKQEQIVRRN